MNRVLMGTPMVAPAPKPDKVPVRQATRAKLDAIAAAKRWTLTECVDALADDFMPRHGIQMPDGRDDSGQRAVDPDAPNTPRESAKSANATSPNVEANTP